MPFTEGDTDGAEGSDGSVGCEVLVLGGGIAGFVAGAKAADLGAEVILLEKDKFALGNGNTLMTCGAYFTAGKSPRSSPDDLYKAARTVTDGVATPERARAWAANCSRALDWLASIGLQLVRDREGTVWIEPTTSVSYGPVYSADVGPNILKKLKGYFESRGGIAVTKTRAVRLLADGSRVIGAEAEGRGNASVIVKSKATVLATGGFQANKEMLREFLGKHADRCKLRSTSSCVGEGLKMAVEVGAKTGNLQYFYGHLQSLKALTDDRFWPYPRLDSLVEDGILVDRSGARPFDEVRLPSDLGQADVGLTNDIARLDDVTSCSLIFDEAAWMRSKEALVQGLPGPNPWLAEKGGDLYWARTLRELGEKLGVDGRNLERTVEEFNAAILDQSLTELKVPRSNRPNPLKGPFYGVRVVPGITFTMGGVMTSGNAEVLGLDDHPIIGLYAAGDITGGLQGGNKGGYTGGLSQAIVTGLIAGENAFRFAKSI